VHCCAVIDSSVLVFPTWPTPRALSYFVEWGGRGWQELVGVALQFLGPRLDGRRILEIGPRRGRMSCLFALLGGHVTGVDLCADFVRIAQAEAVKWGVEDHTTFLRYDGNLDCFPDRTFDVVFTKSVLVTVPNLDAFLGKIAAKLRPGGQVVFLENGRGNVLLDAVRFCRGFRRYTFFGQWEVALVRRVFNLALVRRCVFPPVYLLCARSLN
jgi:SAM-dependent methyltransferase